MIEKIDRSGFGPKIDRLPLETFKFPWIESKYNVKLHNNFRERLELFLNKKLYIDYIKNYDRIYSRGYSGLLYLFLPPSVGVILISNNDNDIMIEEIDC